MKYFLGILCMLMIFLGKTYPHSVHTMEAERFFKEADAVAEAIVEKVEEKKGDCEHTVIVRVAIQKIIRGSVHGGVPLHYRMTDYIWNEKAKCPSVHYAISPRAKNLARGVKIIVTIKYYQEYKANWVTSSYNMEELKSIKRLLPSGY